MLTFYDKRPRDFLGGPVVRPRAPNAGTPPEFYPNQGTKSHGPARPSTAINK